MEDKHLLRGLKQGDAKTLQYIYTNIFPKVNSWITKHDGSTADAYDIFQEVMESILLNIDTIHKSFSATVMYLTKNKWIDKIRKDRTRFKVRNNMEQRQEHESGIESKLVHNELEYLKYKLMEETFSTLSELCQKVITLLKKGKDTNEIVTALKFKSANTMYRRKAACIERWSQIIKENKNYKNLF